jgi:hypothetical protein
VEGSRENGQLRASPTNGGGAHDQDDGAIDLPHRRRVSVRYEGLISMRSCPMGGGGGELI